MYVCILGWLKKLNTLFLGGTQFFVPFDIKYNSENFRLISLYLVLALHCLIETKVQKLIEITIHLCGKFLLIYLSSFI